MTRDPLTEKAILLYGAYGTPASVYKDLRDEYQENSFTYSQVRNIREKYRKDILDARKQLTTKIPILDSEERWIYLQRILDGALEGDIIYDKKTGEPVEAKIDRVTALNTIKLAGELSSAKGVVAAENDDAIRQIVIDAFSSMKMEYPEKSDKELLDEILDNLGEPAKPYIKELVQAQSA